MKVHRQHEPIASHRSLRGARAGAALWQGLLAAVALGVWTAGCIDPATPEALVVGTRLLAVRAEPPQPRDEAAVVFRGLFSARPPVSWRWTLCACPRDRAQPTDCLSEAWACPFSIDEVATLTAASTAPCEVLWETAGVPAPPAGAPIPWKSLASACQRAGGDLGDGDPDVGPWRFGVRVELSGDAGAVTGAYTLRAGGVGPPNRNPDVAGIDVQTAQGDVLAPGDAVEPGERVTLVARADPDTIATADGAAGDARPAETLTWRWFASDGAFSSVHTSGNPASAVWTAPSAASLDLEAAVTWWAVVYDGFGGVGWAQTSRPLAAGGPRTR